MNTTLIPSNPSSEKVYKRHECRLCGYVSERSLVHCYIENKCGGKKLCLEKCINHTFTEQVEESDDEEGTVIVPRYHCIYCTEKV